LGALLVATGIIGYLNAIPLIVVPVAVGVIEILIGGYLTLQDRN